MQRRITLALIAAALSGAPGALAQDSAPANEQKAPAQDAPASTPPAADAPAPELPDVEIQQKAEEPAQQVQPAAPAKTKTAAPKEYYQPVAAKPKNKAAAPPPQAVQQPAAEPFDASQDQASQATGLENPKGAFNGPVAKSTTSGTKTGTPIIEIPQGISVVGAEQISRQNADTIVAATRYAPGIRSETFGGDTRNDWFLIRGFPAQDTGLYLNGLQLFSTAFATWKIKPQCLGWLVSMRAP